MNATGIGWTDFTWNLFSGCRRISSACAECYAFTLAERHRGGRAFPHGFDLTVRPKKLDEPRKLLKSSGPSLIFVESMGDIGLHDDELTPAEIDRLYEAGFHGMDHLRDAVFKVIGDVGDHRYQLLTKRPEVLYNFLAARKSKLPPSVWLGVTLETPREAQRLETLLRIKRDFFGPQNVAFVSVEPMLADVSQTLAPYTDDIDWLIIGGESGTHFADPKKAHRFLVTKTQPDSPERKSEGLYAVKRAALNVVRRLLALKRGSETLRRADEALLASGWQGLAGGCSEEGTSVRALHASLVSHTANTMRTTATTHALVAMEACFVPTFFKQWGGPTPPSGGREVDGRTYDEMPRVRGAMPERRGNLAAPTAGLARKLPVVPS